MAKQKTQNSSNNLITKNNKARHDYTIEQTFEAGLVLEGWEVKSLRENRAQLKESYIILKHDAAWLIGAHLSPPSYTTTIVSHDPIRTRKLLLHNKELAKLHRAKEREGYTIVPLDLHWTRQRAKATIALARGKKKHDKREASKKADWDRDRERILKK